MYIGSAGPGRADGRKARRADGRAVGRPDGRAEGAFWSACTDLYRKNEKVAPNTCNLSMFVDISNHPNAQVPIFTPKRKNVEFARFARGSGNFDAARDLENSRTGARMT